MAGTDYDRVDGTNPILSHIAERSVYLDAYACRVRDDIEYGRALLRLSDQRFDLVGSSVRIDLVFDFNTVKSISHVLVDTKDALHVHGAFDRCRNGTQLNSAILCDSRNTRRQATRQTDEDVLDGSRAFIFGSKDLRMVSIKGELRSMFLLPTKLKKVSNGGVTVGTIDPLAGRTPLELGSFGRIGKRLARVKQRLNVHPVVHLSLGYRHVCPPGLDKVVVSPLIGKSFSGDYVIARRQRLRPPRSQRRACNGLQSRRRPHKSARQGRKCQP